MILDQAGNPGSHVSIYSSTCIRHTFISYSRRVLLEQMDKMVIPDIRDLGLA